MLLLTATAETQSLNPGDFCDTVDGELVVIFADCHVPAHQDDMLRRRKGCPPRFFGLNSLERTTTTMVRDVPMSREDYLLALGAYAERLESLAPQSIACFLGYANGQRGRHSRAGHSSRLHGHQARRARRPAPRLEELRQNHRGYGAVICVAPPLRQNHPSCRPYREALLGVNESPGGRPRSLMQLRSLWRSDKAEVAALLILNRQNGKQSSSRPVDDAPGHAPRRHSAYLHCRPQHP